MVCERLEQFKFNCIVQMHVHGVRSSSTILQCRKTVPELTVRLWNDFSVPVLTWNYLLSELFFLRKFWKMGKTTKNDRNKNGLDQRTGLIFVRVGPNLRKIGPKSSEVSLNMTILNRHLKKNHSDSSRLELPVPKKFWDVKLFQVPNHAGTGTEKGNFTPGNFTIRVETFNLKAPWTSGPEDLNSRTRIYFKMVIFSNAALWPNSMIIIIVAC